MSTSRIAMSANVVRGRHRWDPERKEWVKLPDAPPKTVVVIVEVPPSTKERADDIAEEKGNLDVADDQGEQL
jgi:hypothetical protein